MLSSLCLWRAPSVALRKKQTFSFKKKDERRIFITWNHTDLFLRQYGDIKMIIAVFCL